MRAAWTTIKKRLEPELREIKEKRLTSERDKAHAARQAIVERIYAAHAKSVAPSLWHTLPSCTDVSKMPPFAQVI